MGASEISRCAFAPTHQHQQQGEGAGGGGGRQRGLSLHVKLRQTTSPRWTVCTEYDPEVDGSIHVRFFMPGDFMVNPSNSHHLPIHWEEDPSLFNRRYYPPPTIYHSIVLYAYGNGECVDALCDRAEKLAHTTGAVFVLFDYPYYGRTSLRSLDKRDLTFMEGNVHKQHMPTENDLNEVSRVVYEWLVNIELPAWQDRLQYPQVLLWGRSLGSSVASFLASEKDLPKVGGVVFEAPILSALAWETNLLSLARYMPASMDPFSNAHRAVASRKDRWGPVLIIAANADAVVPTTHSSMLFHLCEAVGDATTPTELRFFPRGDHCSLLIDDQASAFLGMFPWKIHERKESRRS